MTAKWLKNKIVRCAKNWKPARQDIGFFEDWRNFGDLQKSWQGFKIEDSTYFTPLVDRFFAKQTKSSNATVAVVGSVYLNLSRKHEKI